ncbi:uncharacterized protein LOC128864809 [Anastrepha ludens]|uniref:uncharacterized protein LOC128864809 n=1 Tax=Anastrepha ludens TaxID=28586 RepID=UPI0023AF5EAE|nr:uncharacterized protein LOC128864809 [Anastrepha ludens]
MATGEAMEAFRRSSVIARTPPQAAATTDNTTESSLPTTATQRRTDVSTLEMKGREGTPGTPTTHIIKKVTDAPNPQQNPTSCSTNAKQSRQCELIDILGKEIDALIQYVESRRNVHGDIRRMCSIIKRAHTDVLIETDSMERCIRKLSTSKQVQIVSTAGKNTPQTAKRTRAKESPRAATQIATKSPVAKKRKSDSDSSRPQTVNQPMQREEWKKVEKKKKSLKNRKGTIRPMSDAIIIEKKAGGTSYADMLRAVKHSEELKDLSEKVKTMRPTKKGGLLIEFKRSKDVEASSYQMAIENALDGVASVNLKTHTVTIQCKGLIADLNTEDQLLEAITQQAQVKNLKMSAIRSTRTIPGGTQSMYLSLRADDAKKVLELGHLKVGWVRCRVTEVTSPRRCYRCWAYDHVATACKEPDRTKLCRRCGKEGHQAASCKNDEKCALCTGAHAAGSAKCPRYQEAVRLRKT